MYIKFYTRFSVLRIQRDSRFNMQIGAYKKSTDKDVFKILVFAFMLSSSENTDAYKYLKKIIDRTFLLIIHLLFKSGAIQIRFDSQLITELDLFAKK